MSKNIQISENLFIDIVKHFCFNEHEKDDYIKQELEVKLNKVIRRELYSNYKNSNLSDEERQIALQKYLSL